MKTTKGKSIGYFNSVVFFREIKKKLAKRMVKMSLEEQKSFMREVREGKIKIA
ncbi:MAG: hypothetical protein ACPGTO_09425 [Polaribacter sp.]